MPDLTPIQTQYNGHLFRSRLEARWAVFFDALGVRYEYEAEGYQLADRWYLPDFWLPDIGCFVEIKAAPDVPFEEAHPFNHTAQQLAIESNRTVLVIYGNPWVDEYFVAPHKRKEFLWFERSSFAIGQRYPEELWLVGNAGLVCLNPGMTDHDVPDMNGARVVDALLAARSARFEHGQSGRTL
jgi:hypothetical protein